MKRLRYMVLLQVSVVSMLTLLMCSKSVEHGNAAISKASLGKLIFFDRDLSEPGGLACASCHDPSTGFSDPGHTATSEGATKGVFGNRNSPAISYAHYTPALQFHAEDGTYTGGFFMDGRAGTLADQARKPFFNPLEMNLPDVHALAQKIKNSEYYSAFMKLYGEGNSDEQILDHVVEALALFQQTEVFHPFDSKFDAFLNDHSVFNAQEFLGFQLFTDTLKGKCAQCHTVEPDAQSGKILFTDFTYDNLGVPKNPKNKFYANASMHNSAGSTFRDIGLGDIMKDPGKKGLFKVPGLRNIALSAPYFHNGVFNTLEEVVHFYNSRDLGGFDAPEIRENVNRNELGNLGLNADEEKAIVAFLKTLSDGYDLK